MRRQVTMLMKLELAQLKTMPEPQLGRKECINRNFHTVTGDRCIKKEVPCEKYNMLSM